MIESVMKPNTGMVGSKLEAEKLYRHRCGASLYVLEDLDDRWAKAHSTSDMHKRPVMVAKSALTEIEV